MRPIVPILVLVSALWIFGGSYFLAKNSCGGATSAIAPLTILDDDLDFKTSSEQHFSFIPSSSTISIEENVAKAFTDVVNHLVDHPDRQLTLNGFYLESETNPTDFENLGIARAEEIKSFLVNKDSSIIDRILTTGELKEAVYTINEKQIDGVKFEFAPLGFSTSNTGLLDDLTSEEEEPTAVTPEEITSAVPSLALYGEDEIRGIKMDVNLQQQIDNWKSALDMNEGSYLLVTGYADRGSEEKSYDIAYIWSSKVRRFFRNNGIKSKQIKADSKGSTMPLVDADAEDAATKNNRVAIELIIPE